MEDNLRWKTSFERRQPLMEGDLWWKANFSGRQPSVEDNLQWKMTFFGSSHAAYSALWHFFCKCCFHGEIRRSKSPVLKIFQKVEKWAFLYVKIRPFEKKISTFFDPSSQPVPAVRFRPLNFDRGLKTRISRDDRRSIKNDHLPAKSAAQVPCKI